MRPVERGFTLGDNMLKDSGYKPGQTAPKSGQYQQIGPKGEKRNEVTVVKGEPFPPTTQKGSTFTLVDPTNNKSGRIIKKV